MAHFGLCALSSAGSVVGGTAAVPDECHGLPKLIRFGHLGLETQFVDRRAVLQGVLAQCVPYDRAHFVRLGQRGHMPASLKMLKTPIGACLLH